MTVTDGHHDVVPALPKPLRHQTERDHDVVRTERARDGFLQSVWRVVRVARAVEPQVGARPSHHNDFDGARALEFRVARALRREDADMPGGACLHLESSYFSRIKCVGGSSGKGATKTKRA